MHGEGRATERKLQVARRPKVPKDPLGGNPVRVSGRVDVPGALSDGVRDVGASADRAVEEGAEERVQRQEVL